MTLQKMAKHNMPLFVISMGSLAVSIALFSVCFLSSIMAIGLTNSFTYLALAFVFSGIFLMTASFLLFSPKGVILKNHSKQLERQNLEELSEEELHALIDLHRSQKNFEAADRASKYLILKVENEESKN